MEFPVENYELWAERISGITQPLMKDDKHLFALVVCDEYRFHVENWLDATDQVDAVRNLLNADRRVLFTQAMMNILVLWSIRVADVYNSNGNFKLNGMCLDNFYIAFYLTLQEWQLFFLSCSIFFAKQLKTYTLAVL